MTTGPSEPNRRPIRVRDTRWASSCARLLAKSGATPNGISIASIFFGLGSGAAFLATAQTVGPRRALIFILAATCIQARLLCNLFDGMVAVEGGLKTKSGDIYNELPDRLADWAILLGAGYAAGSGSHGISLGWTASILAILTAYVRALGASAKASQHFEGPMAKQHRMAIVTTAALLSVALPLVNIHIPIMEWTLWIIIMGCVITVVRRTLAIIRELEAR